MNILIVGDIPLSPITMGNRKFLVRHCELLKQMGHTISYLYYSNSIRKSTTTVTFDDTNLEDIEIFYFKSPLLFRLLNRLKAKYNHFYKNGRCNIDDYYPYGIGSYINKLNSNYNFDACFVNYFYLSRALTKVKIPIKGLYTHDSFINRNIINKTVSPSLSPNQEAKALNRANIIFALQDIEAEIFKKLAPKSTVKTIYIPLKFIETELKSNHNILFFAGGAYFNIEGITNFIEKVWPEIIKKYPDAKLLIGGGICEKLNNMNFPESVELQGYVEDVTSFYKQGDISINPVFHGSGLKIKTMEGIEYNKIVLTTPHSAQGIFKIEKAPIIQIESQNQWIRTFCDLWENQDSLKEIKAKGKVYVDGILEVIKKEYNSFLIP